MLPNYNAKKDVKTYSILVNPTEVFDHQSHPVWTHYFSSLLVVEGDVGKLLPARPVDGVREPGVVGVQLAPVRQDLKEGK